MCIRERTWGEVTKRCKVKDTRIVENSGMSRSTYQRNTLFVHNDSGGGAQFFAIDNRCRTTAVFTVPGAPAKLSIYQAQVHVFLQLTAMLDGAKQALSEACNALKTALA